jgi:hypothetical protein
MANALQPRPAAIQRIVIIRNQTTSFIIDRDLNKGLV